MSANSKLRDEMRFQLRWDFRRRDSDLDTSSNDSKCSEPDHKRHRPVSSPVHVDNAETSQFQQKGISIDPDPATSGQTEIGKAAKAKRKRNNRDDSNEKKTGTRRAVRKKKVETNAALDDLKKHMKSLLEELKVTRKNMLSWMREEMKKLAAEEKASLSERKKDGGLKAEEVNLFGKNIPIPYQNNFEEHVQVQNPINIEENAKMQNLINLEEDIETKTQEKVQNCDDSGKKGNGRVYKRANKTKKSADCNNLVKPEEDRTKEKSAIPDKSSFKSEPLLEKAQPQKSIVLGIKARNCKDGIKSSALKGKKAANTNNQCQVPDYYAPNFSSESFASSMYLTLPSVLTKSQESPAFSYIQSRFPQNQSGNSSEPSNLMLGSSSHLGYFQPEERSRNYTQMNFRDIGFFNQNSTFTSSMGNQGYTVPLHPSFNIPNHFDLENLPRENNRPNLTVNGVPGLSQGNNYSLPESYNFQIPSNYRTDGRLVSYQDSNQFPM